MGDITCPRCQRALTLRRNDPHTLSCEQCRGQFVLPDDVRAVLLAPATPVVAADEARRSPLACPQCGVEMAVVELGRMQFDRCGQCRGFWLDAGNELALSSQAAGSSIGGLFLYSLSLPERLLRSTVGVAGGMAKELGDRLVPRAFQSSNTYTILVRNSLQFLVHDVGGVQGPGPDAEAGVENFVARKAVGNFVELAGLATLHLSPMLILAIVSDLAYGSKVYLNELADALRKEGLIAEDSTIDQIDDLFEAVGRASGSSAQLFDTPPLSVEDLRSTTGAIRDALTSLDATKALPQAEIRRMWDEMRAVARRDDVNLFQVSSAMTLHALGRIADTGRGTLSGARLAAGMVNRHIIGHYTAALADLQEKGFYATLSEVSTPYIDAVWNNFSAGKGTVTEEVVTGRLPGKVVRALAGWFRRKPSAASGSTEGDG